MSKQRFVSLVDQINNCTICAAHLPMGANPVFRADPKAVILVAGQAPGRRVHETGIPFNDPSGDRLRLWMGVTREQFYDVRRIAILPMGFCYPGTGKNGDLPPRAECAPQWREQLLAHLPNIRLVLAIGQYAQAWHLGAERKSNLTETVKHWQHFGPGLLPLPHPSPRNNLWLRRNPWFEEEVIPHLQQRVGELMAAD
ncbi:uracil-DNA glycosylase family protein [Sedimenticola sp.]|uniref:uracil-DNA glycosylase family protein n=1 Tax=Sedimenticola sp. TaxID=1940285 RepID=UPI003D0D9941